MKFFDRFDRFRGKKERALIEEQRLARLRNEIAQLEAIRDDGPRVAPGGQLHSWCQGAIFALRWIEGGATEKSPGWAASLLRSGHKPE